jgi:hypothetical protein
MVSGLLYVKQLILNFTLLMGITKIFICVMLWIQCILFFGMNVVLPDITYAAPTGGDALFSETGSPSPQFQESYFTDDYGNILMVVNVLGEVNKSGQFVVRENADFATIFALAGGIRPDANLKKVLVARREPDNNGKQAYIVNLKHFYKDGDRSAFIALKPNDTIIIPEKGFNLMKLVQTINVAYPFINTYYLLRNL